MPSSVLCISPHLDDAVFSAGGYIAALSDEGYDVTIMTCFTATVPEPRGFALACQLDKGLPPEVDYMAIRRSEDEQACARVGARAIHLQLPEAPHRGYASAQQLFEQVHDEDTVDDTLVSYFADWTNRYQPDLVLSPVGIGHHVDHQQVVKGIKRLRQVYPEATYAHWFDEPYYSRSAVDRSLDAAPLRKACRQVLSDAAVPATDYLHLDITTHWTQKIQACAAYATQLNFQFGGSHRVAPALQKQQADKAVFSELYRKG